MTNTTALKVSFQDQDDIDTFLKSIKFSKENLALRSKDTVNPYILLPIYLTCDVKEHNLPLSCEEVLSKAYVVEKMDSALESTANPIL